MQTIPTAGTGDPRTAQPTLVYIVGTGRCGSTLLDIMLGADPTIQSTGELNKFSGNPAHLQQVCSCGEIVERCPFWSGVEARIGGTVGLEGLNRGRRFEGTKGLLLAGMTGPFRRSRARQQAVRLSGLIHAIAEQSGKPRVVDSTKGLGRGYLYSLVPRGSLDVRYIHMVRDGRAFMWSKTSRPDGEAIGKRPPKRSPLRLAFLWMTTNLTASLVFSRRSRRYLRIRYEDLTGRPAETLGRVGEFLGVDLRPVIQQVVAGAPIPVSHVVGGNRLRFSQRLVLRRDVEWEQSLPPRERREFWRVAGWLARRYGYRRDPDSAGPVRGPTPG